MTAKYDSRRLQSYADSFYRRAYWAILRDSLIGFLIGFGLDFLLPQWLPRSIPHLDLATTNALVLPLICLIPGFLYGSAQAFHLKLEAQHILCEAQIELDLRRLANQFEAQPYPVQREAPRVTDSVRVPARSASGEETKAPRPASHVGERPISPRTGDVFGLS